MLNRLYRVAVLACASFPAFAANYTFDTDHAQGVFRWHHLGFSDPAGQFSQATGTLKFDPADPTKASVDATIDLKTLQTGLPELDQVLRSADFFDTASFPTASFKSKRVERDAMPRRLKVTGDLSLHGITQPVTLEVTLVKIGTNPRNGLPAIGFDATTTIKRSAFKLDAFVPQVGDDIPMRIILEAYESQAYEKYLQAEAAKQK
jgi:polyisoprenoid-binding protein YceI